MTPPTLRTTTWEQWLDTAAAHPDANHRWVHDAGCDAKWAGAKNFPAAMDLARYGWRDGMTKVTHLLTPLLTDLVAVAQPGGSWAWDVTGATYDVGEYLSGVPECWLTTAPPAPRPTVTIMSETFLSGGTDDDQTIRRGVALMALAMALERSGYAVVIDLACGLRYADGEETWTKTRLADGTGPLDLDRIVYALAHRSALRWLTYGTQCALDGRGPESQWPARTPNPWASEATILVPDLRYHGEHWQSDRSTAAWLRDTFTRLTRQEG